MAESNEQVVEEGQLRRGAQGGFKGRLFRVSIIFNTAGGKRAVLQVQEDQGGDFPAWVDFVTESVEAVMELTELVDAGAADTGVGGAGDAGGLRDVDRAGDGAGPADAQLVSGGGCTSLGGVPAPLGRAGSTQPAGEADALRDAGTRETPAAGMVSIETVAKEVAQAFEANSAGRLVRFVTPLDPGDEDLVMRVVEDNGDRLLVVAHVDMTILPMQTVKRSDVTLLPPPAPGGRVRIWSDRHEPFNGRTGVVHYAVSDGITFMVKLEPAIDDVDAQPVLQFERRELVPIDDEKSMDQKARQVAQENQQVNDDRTKIVQTIRFIAPGGKKLMPDNVQQMPIELAAVAAHMATNDTTAACVEALMKGRTISEAADFGQWRVVVCWRRATARPTAEEKDDIRPRGINAAALKRMSDELTKARSRKRS